MRGILGLWIWVACINSIALAVDTQWQYPCRISDLSSLDCDCWDAIDQDGLYPIHGTEDYLIDPKAYLVGEPPTEKSAVTITTDRWIEVAFSGPIGDGEGADIKIREEGRMGETALIFLSDGQSRTYPLGIASVPDMGIGSSSICEFDLQGVDPGFVPTAIRILSLGLGGGSPGFDLGAVEARIVVDNSKPHAPSPHHEADLVSPDHSLQWTASELPNSVSVYLGTDPNQADPATASPVETLPGYVTSFQPQAPLRLNSTYYWRIVEHFGSSTRVGDLWEFQVSPYFHVENFESYARSGELVYDLELVGYAPWRKTEKATVSLTHCDDQVKAGCHAAELQYDCSFGSQATLYRHFSYLGQNWTNSNAKYLDLSFKGLTTNPLGHSVMLRLVDRNILSQEMFYHADANHIADGQWHTWRINLDDIENVDLTSVTEIHVGVQAFDDTPASQAEGTIYIDEIHISPDIPLPADPVPLHTDLDRNDQLNFKDLALFADTWLTTDQDRLDIQEPASAWCHLSFDSDISDIQGNAETTSSGVLHLDGQQANFNSPDTVLDITNGHELTQFTDGITISFWQWGHDSRRRADTVVCSDYALPAEAPEIAIGLGLWEDPERLYWQCGPRQEPQNLLTGIHQTPEQWSERWNHWAFAKDFVTGDMAVYLNGRPLYAGQGQAVGLGRIETLHLANGWYRDYDGIMDDFRIHDYALDAQECAYLATHGTGILPQPALMPSDFNGDGQVDWQDFAILAGEWLK